MEYLSIFFRTLVVYAFLLVVVRLMGKREIVQLSPFDLVVTIMMGELAAIALETENELVPALLPIGILALMELLLSYVALKNESARRMINGVPVIVIENGKILEDVLRENRYNISDLLAQLRQKDIFDIGDVEFAILETSGELSVIKKSQKREITPEDLNIPTEYEGLSYPLVRDGIIDTENLERLNLSLEWLEGELKKKGISSPSDVLLASIDTKGNLFVARKGISRKDGLSGFNKGNL